MKAVPLALSHRRQPAWRRPWWLYQPLAVVLASATAPTAMIVVSMLAIDAHSDHPLFWWSLPMQVLACNAVAALESHRHRHRNPAADRAAIAALYGRTAFRWGFVLSLLACLASGIVGDILAGLWQSPLAAWSLHAALAAAFSLASFPHAGWLYAELSFRGAGRAA